MISKEATAAAADLTTSQIRELLNMILLVKRITPELVTPELIQREVELSEILTQKMEPKAPTPELLQKIRNIQNQQQTQTRISPLTDIEKYL